LDIWGGILGSLLAHCMVVAGIDVANLKVNLRKKIIRYEISNEMASCCCQRFKPVTSSHWAYLILISDAGTQDSHTTMYWWDLV
jgi:hypothetical protein